MSLTFDFPHWKLQVAPGQQDKAANPDVTGANAGDNWAADLEDLDSEVGDEAASDIAAAGPEGSGDGLQPRESEERDASAEHASGPASGRPEGQDELGTAGGAEYGPGAGPSESAGPGTSLSADRRPPSLRTTDPSVRPPPVAVSGDSIPAEVLLLVLSELRDDVADCVRAALVCKHWFSVAALSNELWLELQTRHLAGGTWHRPPYAGRPLLRPPPGGDHARSRMLTYKTTCALTQVAVRFMALRKGFEYVVEAAASLWLAVRKAAPGPKPATTGAPAATSMPPFAATPAGDSVGLAAGTPAAPSASLPGAGAAAVAGGAGVSFPQADSARGDSSQGPIRPDQATAAVASPVPWAGVDCGGPSSGASAGNGTAGSSGGGSGSGSGADDSGNGSRRITHVDQLWESCGRSRAALQVDERFNAVRVQQMVGKLCCSGAGQWLPLYEGLAAVMTSRCDELRDELAVEAAVAAAAAAAAAVRAAAGPAAAAAAGTEATSTAGTDCRTADAVPRDPWKERAGGGESGLCAGSDDGPGGSSATRGSGSDRRAAAASVVQFRGEVVYSGNSYADQFAELLRRGDTRGALALGAVRRGGGGAGGGGSGGGGGGGLLDGRLAGGEGGGLDGELEEPEMRELEMADCVGSSEPVIGRSAPGAPPAYAVPPPAVEEGLLLWRMLLRAWAVYRRWLEVLVVWCGPLGARVEAERQLAGAAAPHGEAPLAPPHLTNKGLLLFRSQVLLAYPLRRPLQAAATWLAARAAQAEDEGIGFGVLSRRAAGSCGSPLAGLEGRSLAATRGRETGRASDSGHGAVGAGPVLSEEHYKLLVEIRKSLTELAVPDDATQPPHLHTRQKLQRCFGRLLLRPVPGGNRALLAAQRMHVAARTGGGGVGGSGRGGSGGYC